MRRRPLLALAMLAPSIPVQASPPAPTAPPASALRFPRDHGAHPDVRTEWWYITGHGSDGKRDFGFQVTFFRSRVDATQAMASKFAARQLLFAHAAVTDVQGRKLWHDQRIARTGFGIAQYGVDDTRLTLRDWTLSHRDGRYVAHVQGAAFTIDLECTATQPLLLQGRDGLSRKGPEPLQTSFYYSHPQLDASARITLQGRGAAVRGKAWLDHEWSDAFLHPDAVGWDWIGMNLDDGGALTAFRLRRQDGSVVWDGGSYRTPRGDRYVSAVGETEFKAQRRWTSPASGAAYPVEWIVRTPADFYTVKAVIDDQELDSRASTGAIYWEGLADLFDSNGKKVGRGYLEMTGYAARLKI